LDLFCIDLFAGAGGLSTGLQMAGFKTLYANEVSEVYSRTLIKSHEDTFVDTGDIRSICPKNIRRALQINKGELHLLAGGPPCQGFSINAPVRSKEDKRNHLFRDYLRFVEEFLPKAILIENVPGMVSFEKGNTVQDILLALKYIGYSAAVRILFAPHFGVPQTRWRTIILATRMDVDPLLLFPIPTYIAEGRANFTTRLNGKKIIADQNLVNETAKLSCITVADAISDLPMINNGGGESEISYDSEAHSEYQTILRSGSTTIKNHICAKLGAANLVRLPHIPQGGSWRDIPHELLPKGMQRARRSDHTKRYGRLDPDGLASTILTKCDPHWGTYIHPHQDRVLSVREAARLQSFPDIIEFFGNISEQYEQVGNAVPPLFAKSIGDRIANVLFDSEAAERSMAYEEATFWKEQQLTLSL